jgi:predicted SnoaL-like aldol condensation-catalyzing enzyme
MKKFSGVTVIALATFFSSCTNNTGSTSATANPAPPTDSTALTQAAKNKANTLAVYKGVETGDLSVMDNFVADDVVDHGGSHGDIKGRDNVKKELADIHNHISNLKMEMIAEATSGDYHFALVRVTGTSKDDSMGWPANSPVDDTSIDLVRLANGKAVEHWQFMDSRNVMAMMSKMKPMTKPGK